jgi:hypothetical protein
MSENMFFFSKSKNWCGHNQKLHIYKKFIAIIAFLKGNFKLTQMKMNSEVWFF